MIHTCHSQNFYNKDSLTILADSLHLSGDYKAALQIREQVVNNAKNLSKNYSKYIQAKYYHTLSCDYETSSYNYNIPDKAISKNAREKFLDSALIASTKARDLYFDVIDPDKQFQYNLQNRIYHQTAFLGNWKNALKEAQLGLTILKDTLTNKDKKFVDLLYDIGYIYSQLGDYSKAVENYQSSLDLYKNIIGENHTDVAQAYNNISKEYRNLGLKKKELQSLLKAKKIWENLNTKDDNHYLFNCYSNLFYWYSYYGDFAKADEYLAKKNKLRKDDAINKEGIIRNAEDAYKVKLNQWHDLILHSLRKKDTTKAILYIQNILSDINDKGDLLNFEADIYASTLKYYSIILQKKDSDKAIKLISKAIDVQDKYKLVYYTNPIPFQFDKVELLLKQNRINEAETLLDLSILEEKEQKKIDCFQQFILKGKISEAKGETINASKYFDQAFSNATLNSEILLDKVNIENLKPLISFETVDGFLAMGDFYFNLYNKNNRSAINLNRAYHRYELASKIFNNLYLGQNFNNRLFENYVSINKRLLNCAFTAPDKKHLLISSINEIENNGSKLMWSQFMFNNQRKQIKVSDQLLNQEEDLKAQINFYNKKLFDPDENSFDKKLLWEEKIYVLNDKLSKLKDTIKEQNHSYFQFTLQNFDVSLLQNKLKNDEAIIKYVIAKDQVFSILISKYDIKLYLVGNTEIINKTLKTVINKLSNRVLNYKKDVRSLQNLLINQIPVNDFRKITIIPDGFLYYLPFEILLHSEDMPLISYSSSLIIYNEQSELRPQKKEVRLGAFSASSKNDFQLNNTDIEIKNILEIFDGQSFNNSSKETFLKEANKFDILHFAMHSTMDLSNSQYSSLNFIGDKKNNRLFISELYNENFRANLAVLSSCNTGNGKYENGEGVISISRAFTYAGVPSTVMSLWKIPDKESAELMLFFYQNLKKGFSKDKALLQAKIDYLKNTDDELLKHPYYWAGFVLSGDTSPVVSQTSIISAEYILWPFLGIIILLILGVIFKKLRYFIQ